MMGTWEEAAKYDWETIGFVSDGPDVQVTLVDVEVLGEETEPFRRGEEENI